MVPNHGAHFCALPLRTARRRPRLVWATLITGETDGRLRGCACACASEGGLRVRSGRMSRVQLAHTRLRQELVPLSLVAADRRRRGGARCCSLTLARLGLSPAQAGSRIKHHLRQPSAPFPGLVPSRVQVMGQPGHQATAGLSSSGQGKEERWIKHISNPSSRSFQETRRFRSRNVLIRQACKVTQELLQHLEELGRRDGNQNLLL